MCGIVGYIGPKNTVDILYSGLKRLEYRGYDSAGISVIKDDSIWVEKSRGKLNNLRERLTLLPTGSKIGIGHTRWATHGAPTTKNAHPHQAGDVVLIHNGIIENFYELKSGLIKEGACFESETDSEVIAQLLSMELSRTQNTSEAFQTVLKRLEGAFAIGVLFRKYPDVLYVAKSGSPLAVGIGHGENFFASDASAFALEAESAIFLNDGEWATITKDEVQCYNFEGESIPQQRSPLNWCQASVEKQGYKHFMLKEIHEQPMVISETIKRMINFSDLTLNDHELGFNKLDIDSIQSIKIVACGTAYLSGVVGQYFLEPLLNLPVTVEQASEFRYRKPYLNQNTLIISISQSGETADTLASVKHAMTQNCQTLSICNTLHSAIPRASTSTLYMNAGQEIGVASTKAFTSQIICLYLWGHRLATTLGRLTKEESDHILLDLKKIPQYLDVAISQKHAIEQLTKSYYEKNHFLYIGRGPSYPIALEGALKLKEISYIHAEGYSAGELKHGPIALIDRHMPVIAVIPKDHYYEKTLSNIEEILAREGQVIAICEQNDTRVKNLCTGFVTCPKMSHEVFQAIVNTIPVQLFAYYMAVHRGTDVDQPRNLAKSVTVE